MLESRDDMFRKKSTSKNKSEYAIEVDDIDKSFWIPDEKVGSLKGYFLQPWRLFRKQGKRFDALSDISFKVKKGEFVGIIGRNGSGKSTLLKLLAGIYSPDKGNININGKLVPFLELGVGFNPDLSARENIFLNGVILGMSKKFLDSRVEEILEFAGVTKFADTPIKNFSSGMTVRLAFAIAIQAKADIYLLDEVLAVGDDAFRRKSMKKIKQLINSGVTVLFVSHDLSSVETLTDRTIWIDDSRVVMNSKPSAVVEKFQLSMLPKSERGRFLEAREKLKEVKGLERVAAGRNVDRVLELSKLKTDIGDGRARIEEVGIYDKAGKKVDKIFIDQEFSVKVKFRIKKRIENPIAYVSFRKDANTPLMDFNTPVNKDTILPPLEQNTTLIVEFSAKNILNSGIYHLLVFLSDSGKFGKGLGTFATRIDSYQTVEVVEGEKDRNREWRGFIHIPYSVKTSIKD
ncbi:ATP-binding cassette domain-containing protein [Candidatus Dojkabacteria bacterium]|nr:ATP-binding cassette domain-containing protein [Candidatus Dojkabacteria bacterium]